MNILGYLQKIGKALMVPIAVLPAGGLMLGFFDGDCRDKLQGIWIGY
ncbi:hypothetical protein ACOV11_13545 [Vibrio natriegens]